MPTHARSPVLALTSCICLHLALKAWTSRPSLDGALQFRGQQLSQPCRASTKSELLNAPTNTQVPTTQQYCQASSSCGGGADGKWAGPDGCGGRVKLAAGGDWMQWAGAWDARGPWRLWLEWSGWGLV